MPGDVQYYQPYAELHEKPNGPGDRRPTALQIIQDVDLIGKLAGKVFLITGCSSGIGISTAEALHATGADVYITVRAEKKATGEAVLEQISTKSNGKGKLGLILMDLASFDSIRAGVKDFLSKSKTLNVLIENAGIMMCPKSTTVEGFEMHMGTNHFGHFLLFQLLKDTLLASSTPSFQSRVVVVTSAGHRYSPIRFDDINWSHGEYDPLKAYGQSKTANIYMANSIERHYGARGLHATAAHPGGIFETNLIRHQKPDDLEKRFINIDDIQHILKNTDQGAATQVWAAVGTYWNDKGGAYLADIGVPSPLSNNFLAGGAGVSPHAYDEEAEEKLWKISCDAVSIKDY